MRAVLLVLVCSAGCAQILPPIGARSNSLPTARRITVQVQLEGGAPMPYPPTVLTDCGEVATTWNSFSLRIPSEWDNTTVITQGKLYQPRCEATVSLPGFRSQTTAVRDGLVITLKRLGEREGSTISITVLNAPKDSAKAFDKGRSAALRKNWSAAEKSFRTAVQLYPQHAEAWDELGAALEFQGKPREAEAAYQQAVAVDPRFLKPRVHLARLALAEQRFEDARTFAADAITLLPIEFPAAYLYHSIAEMNLKHWSEAEASARLAIQHDARHDFPRSEYVLALLADRRGKTDEALAHFRTYLQIAPLGPESDAARNRVSQLANQTQQE